MYISIFIISKYKRKQYLTKTCQIEEVICITIFLLHQVKWYSKLSDVLFVKWPLSYTDSTHVMTTTFFRVLVFPLQQTGEIADWSKWCLCQNKLFMWLSSIRRFFFLQLNRLLNNLAERTDTLRRRVGHKSLEGLGAFHDLLLYNRNNCLVSLAELFFLLLQEPYTGPFPRQF